MLNLNTRGIEGAYQAFFAERDPPRSGAGWQGTLLTGVATMGTATHLEASILETFSERVHGTVLRPGEDGYDEARTVWNAMIDKEPAVIVQCTGAADVIAAVNFAREHDLLLSVKGGGHNVAGRAVCDDGLMIDCAPMDAVRVDPQAKVAHVQAGARLGDLDHEAQAFGLATPAGVMSETGVAGLALGGGWGWLSRTFGMTVDNIRAVDLVTAEGELVRASPDENPDLFWGIRGGGGNFGVVTTFEFDLHELGPEILAGSIVHRMADAREVLRFWRDFATDAPDEVGTMAGFMLAPAEAPFPEPVHGETVVVLVVTYAGPIDDGEAVLRPLREFGDPLVDAVNPTPYVEQQQMFDESNQAGNRVYVKTHYLEALPDEAIDVAVDFADPMPTPLSSVGFFAMGGAINRVDPAETAFPHRNAAFELDVSPMWTDSDLDDELIAWAREFHAAMAPYSTGGMYGNAPSDENPDATYADNYDRLAELKAEWDPENVFRLNQNVEPTG